MKTPPEWNGRPIVHPDDAHAIDRDAAIFEYKHKLPRDQAEAKAHEEYRRGQHVKGAAFHLNAMKGAHAAGQIDEAKQHGSFYAAHMKQLGYDPHSEPPPEIKGAASGDTKEAVLRFKSHKADQFLASGGKEKSVEKSEPLNKGDLVKLNPPAPTGKKFRAKAKVEDARDEFADRRLEAQASRAAPKPAVQGIHGARSVFDYSHHLPDDLKQAGYALHLSHNQNGPDSGGITAALVHGGKPVSSIWGLPNKFTNEVSYGGMQRLTNDPHPWPAAAVNAAFHEHAPAYQQSMAQNKLEARRTPPELAPEEILSSTGPLSPEHLAALDRYTDAARNFDFGQVDDATNSLHHEHLNRIATRIQDSLRHGQAQKTKEAAAARGLTVIKAEPTVQTPPVAARPAQLHNTVEGFMGGLKALPKGSPERGKFITSHMNSPVFLGALKAHPQGAQIHSMLTQHLNSASNAGFKAGGTVTTLKSETAEALHWIYRAAKVLLKKAGE